jgi:glycine/betaine/sarcosine/D-proline reductase family selenoprotein B
MSRKCVPFTPFDRGLESTVVGIVSATGVYRRDQEPFSTQDPGDIDFRSVDAGTALVDLAIAHQHYDHTDADRDPNIVFPIETVRELAASGIIGGAALRHFTYGFTTRLRELYEKSFPLLVREVERSGADAVLVTAGCPGVCHRTAVTLQRAIEMRGIPTVAITVSPEATQSMRPPRALNPRGFALGRVVGPPERRDVHRAVVLAALDLLRADPRPGQVTVRDFDALL